MGESGCDGFALDAGHIPIRPCALQQILQPADRSAQIPLREIDLPLHGRGLHRITGNKELVDSMQGHVEDQSSPLFPDLRHRLLERPDRGAQLHPRLTRSVGRQLFSCQQLPQPRVEHGLLEDELCFTKRELRVADEQGVDVVQDELGRAAGFRTLKISLSATAVSEYSSA